MKKMIMFQATAAHNNVSAKIVQQQPKINSNQRASERENVGKNQREYFSPLLKTMTRIMDDRVRISDRVCGWRCINATIQ